MVGGRIIENIPFVTRSGKTVRRLWCVDGSDECAVYAEPAAECLTHGENIWWQGREIMARGDKVTFEKIGFSFDPRQ